ncbi:MAG: type II toxin-antitoxin system HicB family antitoxin [Acidobacteria bacterium]|nr:MAG: type II toxin-antitoxin system HicB family antitoxin [Acidobacteriota bacterium]
MSDYAINIFYSEDDAGYIAEIPELPGCSAFGDSPEKALAELQVARGAWISAAKESGIEIPKPVTRHAASGS